MWNMAKYCQFRSLRNLLLYRCQLFMSSPFLRPDSKNERASSRRNFDLRVGYRGYAEASGRSHFMQMTKGKGDHLVLCFLVANFFTIRICKFMTCLQRSIPKNTHSRQLITNTSRDSWFASNVMKFRKTNLER